MKTWDEMVEAMAPESVSGLLRAKADRQLRDALAGAPRIVVHHGLGTWSQGQPLDGTYLLIPVPPEQP